MATCGVRTIVVYTIRDYVMVLLFICCCMRMACCYSEKHVRDTWLKRQPSRVFEIKDLGATKKILDMEIRKDRLVEKLYLL